MPYMSYLRVKFKFWLKNSAIYVLSKSSMQINNNKFNSDYKTVLYLIKVFKYTRSISPNNLTSKKLMKYEEQNGKVEN